LFVSKKSGNPDSPSPPGSGSDWQALSPLTQVLQLSSMAAQSLKK
jgi:hypothetical protein